MVSGYQTAATPVADKQLIFTGTQRNLASGVAMLAAAGLAFSMKLTDVFFAEAVAWVFVLWGALFIYAGLMDMNQTFEVTDEALVVRNAMRPWAAPKVFDWAHLHRLDVVVKRIDGRLEDAVMQIYYTPEGEIEIFREDRAYNPDLARLLIERADLKPVDESNPSDLTQLPKGKATYYWNKSGRIAAA